MRLINATNCAQVSISVQIPVRHKQFAIINKIDRCLRMLIRTLQLIFANAINGRLMANSTIKKKFCLVSN